MSAPASVAVAFVQPVALRPLACFLVVWVTTTRDKRFVHIVLVVGLLLCAIWSPYPRSILELLLPGLFGAILPASAGGSRLLSRIAFVLSHSLPAAALAFGASELGPALHPTWATGASGNHSVLTRPPRGEAVWIPCRC
jgi:hypothetical protein